MTTMINENLLNNVFSEIFDNNGEELIMPEQEYSFDYADIINGNLVVVDTAKIDSNSNSNVNFNNFCTTKIEDNNIVKLFDK